MTVNDLISKWLHSHNPKAVLHVWSNKEIDYIYSTSNPEKYDKTLDEVGKMVVGCFYSYYNNDKDQEVLVINVD